MIEPLDAARARFSRLVLENARSPHPKPLAALLEDFGGPKPPPGERVLSAAQARARDAALAAKRRGIRNRAPMPPVQS